MDREILFRGRRDKEWIDGWYLEIDGISYILPIDGHLRDVVEVDLSTVGQYTGLIDKHGVKIFEGDIIKQINFYDHLKIQGQVVYGKAAQYIVRHTYTKQENPYKNGKTKAFAVSTRCEVIGNIHDNPELMERKGKTHERS